MGVALRAISRKGSLRGVEAHNQIFAVPAFTRDLPRLRPRYGRCRVADEVEVVFYKRASSFSCASKPKRAFACWFHTHFVENGALTLAKHELDKACKDKKASPDLSVSISFRPPPKARKASNRTPSPNNVVP